VYEPLGKVNAKTNFTNIDTDIINPTTNQELNIFSNNYTGYLQTQIGILNSSNENNVNSYYNEEINNNTDIDRDNAKNNLLQTNNISTGLINDSINEGYNNITENFENNFESNNNDKSKTIKFYLFIFIVIIFLYIVYYLKKNKHFK
jgi:hypothetical protein